MEVPEDPVTGSAHCALTPFWAARLNLLRPTVFFSFACSGALTSGLLGPGAPWNEVLGLPGANLHLYGKHEARPGRKMGHVTRVRREG